MAKKDMCVCVHALFLDQLFMGHICFLSQSIGGCNRCQMINVVHKAGGVQKTNEPLATLASYRRVKVSQNKLFMSFDTLLIDFCSECM